MRSRIIKTVLSGALIVALSPARLQADETEAYPLQLVQSNAVNLSNIIDRQFGHQQAAAGFAVADPYAAESAFAVEQWSLQSGDEEVCAVRFVDDTRVDYHLQNFDSPAAADAAGFVVTHYGRCGSCSTLRDLSRYLAVPNLATPARQCARRLGLKRKRQCFEEEIGFTPMCAESWAYNARNTRQACFGVCASDYGFFNLLFGRFPGANTDESGQLRPCLQCDEELSGPGFKYSAGRTRRNSGIESAIDRGPGEIREVDHSAYFDP